MARSNKRTEILNAVVRIIERGGIVSVTLDAVANEAGLSRPGLLYHFSSSRALLEAVHDHLAKKWDEDLQTITGKPWKTASAAQRRASYINLCVRSIRKVELHLLLDSVDDPKMGELWRQVLNRWVASSPRSDSTAELDAFIARLAADGLWIHQALSGESLPEPLRMRVAERLVAMSNSELGDSSTKSKS